MLSLPAWKCPEWTLNASQVNTSSPEFIEEWQKRIREVTGELAAKLMHLLNSCYPTPCKRDGLLIPRTQTKVNVDHCGSWHSSGVSVRGWRPREQRIDRP